MKKKLHHKLLNKALNKNTKCQGNLEIKPQKKCEKDFLSKTTAQLSDQNTENMANLSREIDVCGIIYIERVERSLKNEYRSNEVRPVSVSETTNGYGTRQDVPISKLPILHKRGFKRPILLHFPKSETQVGQEVCRWNLSFLKIKKPIKIGEANRFCKEVQSKGSRQELTRQGIQNKSTLARECLITNIIARTAITPQGGFCVSI